jgi:hypothetical protein
MDDDINVFQPSLCLSRHLADLPVDACCEQGLEPCDGWGKGPITSDIRPRESLQSVTQAEAVESAQGRVEGGVAEEEEKAAEGAQEVADERADEERDVWGLPVLQRDLVVYE